MGYSERYCHICGVSFNVGRVRTKDEPRSHAWREGHIQSTLSFVDGGRNSHIGECARDAGCMLAFREDMAEEIEKRERENDRRKRGQPTEMGGLDKADPSGGRDDGDDEDDKDFVLSEMDFEESQGSAEPRTNHDSSVLSRLRELVWMSAENQAVEVMDYEYDSPTETCDESEGKEQEERMIMAANTEDDDAEILYRKFIESLNQEEPVVAIQGENELMLPLFRPLESGDGDVASTHGSNDSFDCDETENSDKWRGQKLDHWISGKLSHFKHPLSDRNSPYERDAVWEHIAGSGCLNGHGYHGTSISKEEMRFANTLQCLVRKTDANAPAGDPEVSFALNWQPEWDDEPWEQGASWFLSGISDYMPSRDCDDPEVFPQRHGRQRLNAENVCWESDNDDVERQYAMPFHPACLEVYKRVSIERHGTFNVDHLGSWWRLTSRYDDFHEFPRSEAVKRGEGQWWQHNPGDEHLAADPLWPPGLVGAIASAKLGAPRETVDVSLPSRWTSLPLEIVTEILNHLDVVSIAKTSLAIPETRSIAGPTILRLLQKQRPYLWELTSNQPHYKWVGLTAQELLIRQKVVDQKRAEYLLMCEILDEEGYKDLVGQLKQQWESNNDIKKLETFEPLLSEKHPSLVPTDEIGIAMFVIALYKAEKSNNLHGLRNRERIWQDCETILDQIEGLRERGEILPDGQPRPGAQLYER